jgi:hypothetical protein
MNQKPNGHLLATVILTIAAGVFGLAYWAIRAGEGSCEDFVLATSSLALFKLGLVAVVISLLR